MSYTYSFFDNQLIGVDELNKITSRFVTSGVARQPSSVADLNGFVTDIATKGVVGDTSSELKVTLEDGKIKINTGTAFFDNGTVIEVTEPELIDCKAGVDLNIYLKSDINNNSIYPVCSESYPESEENIVHLAQVSADGTVTDRREYARGKCAYYYSSHGKAVQLSVSFTPDEVKNQITKEYDIGSSDFKFMNVYGYNGSSSWSAVNYNYYFGDDGLPERSCGMIWGDVTKDYYGSGAGMWAYTNGMKSGSYYYIYRIAVDVKIADGKLLLTPSGDLQGYNADFSVVLV